MKLEESFIWIDSAYKGRRTKSGKGRWVPMTPRLREAMQEHFAKYRMQTYDGKRSKWVFHHEYRIRGAKAGDRINCLRRGLMGAAEDAELPQGFVQHDLRHRRVTKWFAQEKNPVHVKEAVGHAQLQTTMQYTHLAREHLRSLVEAPVSQPAEASR